MAYQLAVWDGMVPLDDESAGAMFLRHSRNYLTGRRVPVRASIREFVGALAEQWPETPGAHPFRSPWARVPLYGEAAGPLVVLSLAEPGCVLISGVIALMAAERGLVCFDPQIGMRRPVPEHVARATADGLLAG